MRLHPTKNKLVDVSNTDIAIMNRFLEHYNQEIVSGPIACSFIIRRINLNKNRNNVINLTFEFDKIKIYLISDKPTIPNKYLGNIKYFMFNN